MGLAASQARFLGITARKSNIEYEGQQVNQQRTALAQEVNALYSKLLALDVPVAPNTTEFYETNYSFELTNTKGADNTSYDGSYLIKSYYQNDDGSYYLNTERTYNKNVAEGTYLSNGSISSDGQGGYTLNVPEDSYQLTLAQNSESMIKLINETYPETPISSDGLYCYRDKDGVTHYIDKAVVEKYPNLDANESLTSYISTNKEVTETVVFENAQITLDENNRFKSAKVTVPGTQTSVSTSVDTTRTYDTEGYDAALRDYTMSKEEYDKEVADLNAQTESLQQEDKVLELRLNQIDTEQQELQTELEAVKNILDKNIENTFNTFS